MWGLWWVFPLIGLVLAFACIIMMARSMSKAGGLGCMGRHRGAPGDHVDELGREVRGLREEVDKLKAGR